MMNKDAVLISSLDDPRMKLGDVDYTTWGVALLKTSLRAALERESAKDARVVEYLALLNDQAQTIEILRAENEKLRKAVERAKDVEWMAKALGKQVAEDLSVFFHVTQQISETQFHQVVGNIVADAIINYLTKRGE